MNEIRWMLFFIATLSCGQSISQTVAILDQGYNETLDYRGKSKFAKQMCFSFNDWRSTFNFSLPHSGGYRWQISLCPNGRKEDFSPTSAATYPRKDIKLFDGPSVSPPFNKYKTTDKLTHGRDTSNALYDFDKNISHIIYQVYGFDSNNAPRNLGNPSSNGYNDVQEQLLDQTSGYKSLAGNFIVGAMNRLAVSNTGDLGAVAIATVVGSITSTPSLCTSPKFGQKAVDLLNAKGIAVVAGLRNRDTLPNVKSWPNCLDGVINVGNTNTRSSGGGIGIGANSIDFYISSATAAPDRTEYGNSLSSPKIAGAFALLHKAHPSSTVIQKYQALERASARRYSYGGFKRRRITHSQMKNAHVELNKIIFPNGIFDEPDIDFSLGEVIASNPNRFGFEYGGDSSDKVELNATFKAVSGSLLFKEASSTDFSLSDIAVQITGSIVSSIDSNRLFNIYVNDQKVATTRSFANGTETTQTVSISRNALIVGENKIEVRPVNPSVSWGLRNIKIALLPTVSLIYGKKEKNIYGTTRELKRHTSLKYEFDLEAIEDSLIYLVPYDIDVKDEIKISINGRSLGYLPKTNNSQFGSQVSFSVNKSLLKRSNNLIELTQKKPSAIFNQAHQKTWAVKDMLVDKARPDLMPSEIKINDMILSKDRPFSVSTIINNIGTGASSPTNVQFYVSGTRNIDPSDSSLIATYPIDLLPAQSTATMTRQVGSSDVNSGQFLGICIVPVSNEVDIDNNCGQGVELESSASSVIVPTILNLLLLNQVGGKSTFRSSVNGWKIPNCSGYKQKRSTSAGPETSGSLLVREDTDTLVRPDQTCNPVETKNMEIAHYKDFDNTGSSFEVKGFVRARSNYSGTSSITNSCVNVLNAKTLTLLKRNCTNYPNKKDSGWQGFDYDFTPYVTGVDKVRVVIGTWDSWSTNWQQRIFIDDIEVTND